LSFQSIADRLDQSYMSIYGGGGEDVISCIGETGISSSDTIDGFRSIFVNGVEYETDTVSIVLDSKTDGIKEEAILC